MKIKDIKNQIGLGTWPFGGEHWGDFSKKDAQQTIHTAIDLGIEFIDTAPVYGDGLSEQIIGETLSSQKRKKIIIATKCGLNKEKNYQSDLSKKFIREEIKNSLKRLQTDYIDLYQCHWPDPRTPIEETMEILEELKTKGYILQYGLSNYNLERLTEASKYGEIFSLQNQYSLLKKNSEKKLIPYCQKKNILPIFYGTLAGGVLSGKYKKRIEFPKNDVRYFFYNFYKEKYWGTVQKLILELKNISKEQDATPGQIAIAWINQKYEKKIILTGAKNPKQIKENFSSLKFFLSIDEIKRLDIISDKFYICSNKNPKKEEKNEQ